MQRCMSLLWLIHKPFSVGTPTKEEKKRDAHVAGACDTGCEMEQARQALNFCVFLRSAFWGIRWAYLRMHAT